MKKLVIERQAIRKNAACIKEKAGPAQLYAVVTGDGHGVGLVELARILRDEGISRFAVAEARDAAALRKAGLVEEEILMLRASTDPEELQLLLDLNAVCTIASQETGVALNGVAEGRATVAEAHLRLDAGLGYGGFPAEDPEKLLALYRYLPGVAISGIYTQLPAGAGAVREAEAQLVQFRCAVDYVRNAGFETGVVHAAGSFALLNYEFARLDGVRAGSAFLGRCRRSKNDGLTRVGYGETTLEDIHWLPRGHVVAGDRPVRFAKATRIAVLPVGWQNGVGAAPPRSLGLWGTVKQWWHSRRMHVTIGGQRARIIGSPGALETLVDVTDLKCTSGDVATFELDPRTARALPREYRP